MNAIEMYINCCKLFRPWRMDQAWAPSWRRRMAQAPAASAGLRAQAWHVLWVCQQRKLIQHYLAFPNILTQFLLNVRNFI